MERVCEAPHSRHHSIEEHDKIMEEEHKRHEEIAEFQEEPRAKMQTINPDIKVTINESAQGCFCHDHDECFCYPPFEYFALDSESSTA